MIEAGIAGSTLGSILRRISGVGVGKTEKSWTICNIFRGADFLDAVNMSQRFDVIMYYNQIRRLPILEHNDCHDRLDLFEFERPERLSPPCQRPIEREMSPSGDFCSSEL